MNKLFDLVKKLVLACDPDFTKVTPDELKAINIAELINITLSFDRTVFKF